MTTSALAQPIPRAAAPALRPVSAGEVIAPAPAPPTRAITCRSEADRAWPADTDREAPVRSVPSEDPAAWCGSLVRAAVEALTGSRPVAQLARWTTGDIYTSLARRAGLAVRIKGRPRLVRQAVVRSVRTCQVEPLITEAAVVVHDGTRVRAAAVRIEAHRGRWRATALEIG